MESVSKDSHAAASLLIRQARRDDLPAMEWEGEYTHFRRLYQEAFESARIGHALLWVVEQPGGGLVAQAFVQLVSSRKELADGVHRAYVYGLRVRREHRRNGIGTRLMQAVEADLYRRGFRLVCLNVSRDNGEAKRLYERLGYRIVAVEEGRWSYIDDRGVRQYMHEPAWRMEKRLSAPDA
jgi:ribosomal protein S18 acetylase RimI-like enzyme